jgi:hypothetical protein
LQTPVLRPWQPPIDCHVIGAVEADVLGLKFSLGVPYLPDGGGLAFSVAVAITRRREEVAHLQPDFGDYGLGRASSVAVQEYLIILTLCDAQAWSPVLMHWAKSLVATATVTFHAAETVQYALQGLIHGFRSLRHRST